MHYITQYFSRTPQWSWVSVIDILLVAALIYYVLRLVRGTLAAPMLL